MKTHVKARPCGRRDRGYTLIELALTLTVLGILVALATPRLEGFLRQNRLRSAVDRISSDMAMARLAAVREGRPTSFRVESSTRYRVTVDDAAGSEVREVREVNLASEYAGVTISGGSQIRFDSRGMLNGAESEVEASRDGRTASVFISGVGRIYRDYDN